MIAWSTAAAKWPDSKNFAFRRLGHRLVLGRLALRRLQIRLRVLQLLHERGILRLDLLRTRGVVETSANEVAVDRPLLLQLLLGHGSCTPREIGVAHLELVDLPPLLQPLHLRLERSLPLERRAIARVAQPLHRSQLGSVLRLQLGERLLNLSPGSICLELALPVPGEGLSPVALLILLCPHDLRLSTLSSLSLCTEQRRGLTLLLTPSGCRRRALLLKRSFVLSLHRTSPLYAILLELLPILVELLTKRSGLGAGLRLPSRRACRVSQRRLQLHAELFRQFPPAVLLLVLPPHAGTQHLHLAGRQRVRVPLLLRIGSGGRWIGASARGR